MATEYTLGAELFGSPAQVAAVVLLALAVIGAASVYGPLFVRLGALARFVRSLSAFGARPYEPEGSDLDAAFQRSPAAASWRRFKRDHPGGTGFSDTLARQPLLPRGVRRTFLPAMPLLLALAGGVASLAVWRATPPDAGAGAALLPGIVGLVLALVAGVLSTWLFGRFAALSSELAEWVDTRVLPAAAAAPDALADAVEGPLGEGLDRIERAALTAAERMGEGQQRAALRVLEDLGGALQDGVGERLAGLQAVVRRSIEQQQALANLLSQHLQRLVEDSESHSRVSFSLEQAAVAIEESSRTLGQANAGFGPVVTGLREAETGFRAAAEETRAAQASTARTVEGLERSLEQASALGQEQQRFLESHVGEIRASVELLSQGLGDELTRALGNVEDVVEKLVTRLGDTLSESSDAIGRIAPSMRSAEGMTREMRNNLEQLRNDLSGVSDWLVETSRPARAALSRLDDRTQALVRALTELSDQARQFEPGAASAPAPEAPPEPRAVGPDPWAREAPPSEPEPEPPSPPEASTSSPEEPTPEPQDGEGDPGGLSGLLSRHQFSTGEAPASGSDGDAPGGGGLRDLLRRGDDD